jgi:hypothetical protein
MGYTQIEASEHGPLDLRPPKYKFGGRSPTSELHRIHKYSSGTFWLIEHLAAYIEFDLYFTVCLPQES